MKRADITNLFPNATDDQINTLMGINGNDINNAKRGLEELQQSLKEAQSALSATSGKEDELKEALEKMSGLQTELDSMKAAESLRLTREKVAQATGVPANLLTGETEESCNEQAQAILKFAQPDNSYPVVKDSGEVHVTPKQTTREQFAEWFNAQ